MFPHHPILRLLRRALQAEDGGLVPAMYGRTLKDALTPGLGVRCSGRWCGGGTPSPERGGSPMREQGGRSSGRRGVSGAEGAEVVGFDLYGALVAEEVEEDADAVGAAEVAVEDGLEAAQGA